MTAIIITLFICITALMITLVIDKGITDRERIREVAKLESPGNKLLDKLFGKKTDWGAIGDPMEDE
ncbi:MAG: hypothetical protein IKF99_11115 [Oscillospiraceae bacterium]|nr:hypothetical protein [Oscillospiraceae bacterium]